MRLPLGVRNVHVVPVQDDRYSDALQQLVRGAKIRCLCSMFIVDALPRRDEENRVYALLLELRRAAWRGVDTRVLIGGSRNNIEIAEVSQFGRDVCGSLGIDCRWLTGGERKGSHAKLAIIDDYVVAGSHNWSAGAFTNQTQDSVIIQSVALAEAQGAFFDTQWARAGS